MFPNSSKNCIRYPLPLSLSKEGQIVIFRTIYKILISGSISTENFSLTES